MGRGFRLVEFSKRWRGEETLAMRGRRKREERERRGNGHLSHAQKYEEEAG